MREGAEAKLGGHPCISASLVKGGMMDTALSLGLLRFHAERADFLTLFWFLFIIAMSWNVVDLLVMDWLLVCTVRPAWLIIPGTENCSSYSDYGHHFKGFLIGCVYTTLMALLFAGVDYAILRFVIWG